MSDERIFTAEELSLMRKLGLTPDKVAALTKAANKQVQRDTKRKQNCFLTEYYLAHIDTCKLCGSKKVSYFKMQKELTVAGGILHSVLVSQEEFSASANQQKKNDFHLTCSCCADTLEKLEKAELVKLCITLQRRMVK